MKKFYTVSKNKTGSYCGSDHELLIAKFRLKWKKVDKNTRPFRYDQNQIPYDYTVKVKVKSLSHVQLFATPWTITYQDLPTMGFPRQEYWSGLPFPSPVIKYEVIEMKLLSCVLLFATPWTVAYQAPPFMGFSRQENWNGLPFRSPVI